VRLNLNLASKPYVDVRRVLKRWTLPVLLLAVCTVALIGAAAVRWMQAREINAKISGLSKEVAALDRQYEESLALLHLPENRSVVESSIFLNGLIARKSFSWTQAFMQLEKIMPPRLRVVSITPVLEPQTNSVQVMLSVAGSSHEAALELVRGLEQSPWFKNARIAEEAVKDEKGSKDAVVFHLAALYVSRPEPEAASAPAPAGDSSKPANATDSGGGAQ
jgi:type IV pilus assembly protein PilN